MPSVTILIEGELEGAQELLLFKMLRTAQFQPQQFQVRHMRELRLTVTTPWVITIGTLATRRALQNRVVILDTVINRPWRVTQGEHVMTVVPILALGTLNRGRQQLIDDAIIALIKVHKACYAS
jgi:hypothetical protein